MQDLGRLRSRRVAAHLEEVYDADVSKETISKFTDAIVAEMNDWLVRPLERVYPVVVGDAIVVKVRDRSGRQPGFLHGDGRDRGRSTRHPRHLASAGVRAPSSGSVLADA